MAQVKMGVTADQLKGIDPVPGGWYKARITGFKPTYSKNKESINLNPQLKIAEHKEFTDRMLFENLNTKAPWIMQDFAHAAGLPMDKQPDGTFMLPILIEDNGHANDPTKWSVKGPLIGRTIEVEVVVSAYNGKPNNKIKSYKCAISDCNRQYPDCRHSTNLLGKG